MAQIFNIINDTVVIEKLDLKQTSGPVTHTGTLTVRGSAQFDAGLTADTITANTINVKNLVTENGQAASLGDWSYEAEQDVNGKGLSWKWKNGAVQLMYKSGKRLWTNANIDLDPNSAFSINNVPVLLANKLGDGVIDSKLRSVGKLKSLDVVGTVSLGEFAFFTHFNRFGIGTEEPNAAIGIIDNNVELIFGSPVNDIGNIGTFSNHDFNIVSDNIPRIRVKRDGEVVVGADDGSGVLRVNGTIIANSIETDNRINRTHPLEFKATADTTIFGLGLVWSGTGRPRQLVMMSNPDRLLSTESIDLNSGRSYHIGTSEVLTETALGASVLSSSLTKLGTLEELTVSGVSTLAEVNVAKITVESIELGNVTVNSTGIAATDTIVIGASGKQVIYGDAAQVSIGDNASPRRAVKVFGQLSVGVNNPDPSLNFSVGGDVNIGGKRFTNGSAVPTAGIFQVGDICWNTNPQGSSYIGWVCTVAGEPGQWLPFGAINTH